MSDPTLVPSTMLLPPGDPALDAVQEQFAMMYAELDALGLMLRLSSGGGAQWRRSIERGLGQTGAVAATRIGAVVAGFAFGQIKLPPPWFDSGRIGVIAAIYVMPMHRRSRIGHSLATTLLSWFAAREVSSVELQVVWENAAAKQFWEALGFRPELTQYRALSVATTWMSQGSVA